MRITEVQLRRIIREELDETHDQVISRMLDMDHWTFDQSKEEGYQSLPTLDLQIDALRAYVKGPMESKNLKKIPKGKFHDPKTIIWHLGQALAIRGGPGDKAQAVGWMKRCDETDDDQWNNYVDATIAFLEGDWEAFKKHASVENRDPVTLERLRKGWGKSYSQAY